MPFTAVAKGVADKSMYGYEQTFGTLATTVETVFGNGANVTLSQNNNTERLYALGDRNAQKLVEKRYEATWNAEFSLGNAYFLMALMGTKTAESGSGPYSRTYEENGTCPSLSISNVFNLDTDSRHNILGAKVNSMTLNCNVGEIVTARLEGFAQKLTKTTTAGTTATGDSEDPMIFSQASLVLGSTGSADVNVQSMEINITNNTEYLWGLGSRFATKGVEKTREYAFRINEAYETDTMLHDNFLGGATGAAESVSNVAKLVATFTNGLSGASERTLVATFNTVQLPTYDYNMVIEEITKEDATLWALNSSGFTYTNNSVDSPGP